MGNRAVVTDEKENVGIYLHWNGGRDSVEAFLTYCKAKGYRSPDTDNYDNGTYIIKNWRIVGRKFKRSAEQQEYDLLEMLKDINQAQPEKEQLTEEELQKAVKESE